MGNWYTLDFGTKELGEPNVEEGQHNLDVGCKM